MAATTTEKENKKEASRKGSNKTQGQSLLSRLHIGWMPGKKKSRVRVGSGRTVVGIVGEKGKRLNIGGLAARLAATALLIELAVAVAPRVIEAAPAALSAAPEAAVDASCTLREWTGNSVVDPHWPDIRRWCGSLMAAGQTYNLDPYLLAAVMLQESGGQPNVISGSGAVGLLQVMPRDGIAAGFQCATGPCFAARPSTDELKDPDFNIDYGARLLAGNATRTGSLREALRAYGPNDVGYRYADNILSIYQQIKQ